MGINNLKYSKEGLLLTEQFEGCRLAAYPDPGTGGDPWTIGYGHTKGVRKGMTCTQAQAEQWLLEDVQDATLVVNSYVTSSLNQHEFDALVDFVFNVGGANFKNSSMLRLLNNNQHERAAQEFERWSKANGKVMAGLLRRRKAERDEFLEPSA